MLSNPLCLSKTSYNNGIFLLSKDHQQWNIPRSWSHLKTHNWEDFTDNKGLQLENASELNTFFLGTVAFGPGSLAMRFDGVSLTCALLVPLKKTSQDIKGKSFQKAFLGIALNSKLQQSFDLYFLNFGTRSKQKMAFCIFDKKSCEWIEYCYYFNYFN